MIVRKVKQLNGHSGCKVFLMKTSTGLFVRKTSAGVDYNHRLKKQMKKQCNFVSQGVRTPSVINEGYDQDLYWYDMDFINGKMFTRFMEHSDRRTASKYFEKIFEFIKLNNNIDENIKEQIVKKINFLPIPSEYNYFKDYCLDFDWEKIQKSYCHGDLTFENILISNGFIYFIDFLDSFADSKIIDYSKILQDVILGWSWRHDKINPYVRLVYVHDYMVNNISNNEYEACKRMLILNILRILPYCKTKEMEYIIDSLDFLKRKVV